MEEHHNDALVGSGPVEQGPVDNGDELATLEADIASVASALETIDRIVAEDRPGAEAAEEIRTVVSEVRFGVVAPLLQNP